MRTIDRALLGSILPLLIAAVGVLAPGRCHATAFSVDSALDVADAAPGDGRCATTSGVCTLRAAVQEANALPGDDAVDVPAGNYVLTVGESGADSSTGALVFTSHLTVTGAGADETILQGGGNDRVILVASAAVATIADVTIRNGRADSGAGIENEGTLEVVRCTVSDNSAGYQGGGIENGGTLSVNDSTVRGNASGYQGGGMDNEGSATVTRSSITANSAEYEGGGLNNYGRLTIVSSSVEGNSAGNGGGGINLGQGLVTVEGSTIGGNTAGSEGGGIDISSSWLGQPTAIVESSTIAGNSSELGGGGVHNTGGLELRSSTVSHNTAGSDGGGIDNDSTFYSPATVIVTNSTISGNAANGTGGGLANDGAPERVTLNNVTIADNSADDDADDSGDGGGIGGAAVLANSIVAGNFRDEEPQDCAGRLASQGHNLIEEPSGCEIMGDGGGDVLGADPLLGPLADNGGSTRTHALLAGSPALDAGSPLAPCGGLGACEALDQSGAVRPGGAACDMGALEVQAGSALSPFCPAGSPIERPRLVLRRLSGEAGNERAAFRGALVLLRKWPPRADIRIMLEDLGSEGAALELTAFPAMRLATHRSRNGRVRFVLHTRRATVARPVGPIRATVLVADASSAAATCSTYTFSPEECRLNRAASRLTCNGVERGRHRAPLRRLDSGPDPLPDLSGAWLLLGDGAGEECVSDLLVPPFVSKLSIRQCGPRLTAVSEERWFSGTVSAGGFDLEAGSAGLVHCDDTLVVALPRLSGTVAKPGGGIPVTQGFELRPLFPPLPTCTCSTSWSGTMSRSAISPVS
jgi:hypothetical protein